MLPASRTPGPAPAPAPVLHGKRVGVKQGRNLLLSWMSCRWHGDVCIRLFLCDKYGGGGENRGSKGVGSDDGEIVMIGGRRGEGGKGRG